VTAEVLTGEKQKQLDKIRKEESQNAKKHDTS
jgi:hypothetical protein